jgi:hypothetical protein
MVVGMSRTRHRAYAGATKAATLAAAATLGPRWVVQPKVDGIYVRLFLDGRGRVAGAATRAGLEVHRSQLDGILGQRIGWPLAELVGELVACGQPLVHLFDCVHDGRRSLTGDPYHARRDALWRMQSDVECASPRPEGPRDARTGRYAARRLTGWRVAPIVPQAPLSALERLWGEVVVEGDGEGLVAVNLDAPAGARASKLKIKPWEGLDCDVVGVARTTVTCLWRGSPFVVARRWHEPAVGDVVEVRHSGWYAGGQTPKWPSLVRVRRDMLI